MLPNTAAQSTHIEKYHFVDFQSLVIWDPWRTGITDVVRESAYHVLNRLENSQSLGHTNLYPRFPLEFAFL